ncbi:MAG: 4'-phosphopantetheinyl transferase superfamily protein [Ktedonobacteraceae bacterium]|nr:4'-phosphopantetheinyl transferase superfamily protein [Ktedonobacteraceae bacterium]
MHSSQQVWMIPSGEVRLTENSVHVWRAALDVPLSSVHHLRQALSPDEVTRAQRLYFERDRQRWIVARGLLRTLLGHYTHTDPRLITFTLNDYGKPEIAFPHQKPLLRFNISHSADIVLYAFAQQRTLGVDVEYMRSPIEYDELARHSFSAYEQGVLRDLPQEQKHQAFYHCWTRKEAYIKARGLGLSLPLDLFDVSLDNPAKLLASREHPEEARRWSMLDLAPGEGYAGALVAERSEWQISLWQWSFEGSS